MSINKEAAPRMAFIKKTHNHRALGIKHTLGHKDINIQLCALHNAGMVKVLLIVANCNVAKWFCALCNYGNVKAAAAKLDAVDKHLMCLALTTGYIHHGRIHTCSISSNGFCLLTPSSNSSCSISPWVVVAVPA